MKLHVKVTRDHIRDGGRALCKSCPVALAIHDADPRFPNALVGGWSVSCPSTRIHRRLGRGRIDVDVGWLCGISAPDYCRCPAWRDRNRFARVDVRQFAGEARMTRRRKPPSWTLPIPGNVKWVCRLFEKGLVVSLPPEKWYPRVFAQSYLVSCNWPRKGGAMWIEEDDTAPATRC